MNTDKTIIKSQPKKLGFTLDETSQVVVNLKQVLADFQVFYHKLRKFHWNVEGPDFFELHEEFENEYNTVAKNIDIIAERMRVFNIKPMLSMEDIVKVSNLKELEEPVSGTAMVSEILKDYEIMHSNLLDLLNTSLEIGDNVTEQIVTDIMRTIEKRNWMFTSWCK